MKLIEINQAKDLDETIQLIKDNCKPYLNAGAPTLYRGMNLGSRNVTKINLFLYSAKVRKDRQPKDSSIKLHEILNNFFKKHMGVAARSESVFCTGKKDHAGNYTEGFDKPNVIIPIGNFKYVWSHNIDDAYESFEENWRSAYMWEKHSDFNVMMKNIADILGMDSENIRSLSDKDRYEVIEAFLEEHGAEFYTFNKRLAQAAESGHEIMIVCDEYYVLEKEDILIKARR